MYNRLYKYSQNTGFQVANLTDHVVIQLVSQILQAFNENEYTIGIFMDLSREFDIVDHPILT